MDTEISLVGHLAWCGLIALYLARHDGKVSRGAQENLFLIRWLAMAEKQRRFRKELASDIRWLLREGREKGVRADLPGKLEYLWRSGTGELLAQNDLYRLQHALHLVQSAGWVFSVLTDTQWEGKRALRLNPAVSGLYMLKGSFNTAFDYSGQQTAALPVRITGDMGALDTILLHAGWQRQKIDNEPLLYHFHADKGNYPR